MITEDHVSFETAKLLKEKGFDADIDLWYDKDGNIFDCYKYDISRNWRVKEQQEVYFCPTIQMACKWLKETHNLFILVWILSEKGYWFNIEKVLENYNHKELYSTGIEDIYYPSPEQAREEAIKYSLKNLI